MRRFRSYLWIGNMQHMRCYETALNFWRRLRSNAKCVRVCVCVCACACACACACVCVCVGGCMCMCMCRLLAHGWQRWRPHTCGCT
jgi:hypothetical protein